MWKGRYISTEPSDFLYKFIEFYKRRAGYVIMYKVDLNSDLGESFGRYTIGNDDKIIPLISSANIACGFHASDPVVMTTAIEQTKRPGFRLVRIRDFRI